MSVSSLSDTIFTSMLGRSSALMGTEARGDANAMPRTTATAAATTAARLCCVVEEDTKIDGERASMETCNYRVDTRERGVAGGGEVN